MNTINIRQIMTNGSLFVVINLKYNICYCLFIIKNNFIIGKNMEKLSDSLFLYRNDEKQIAYLYDLNSSKQYKLPYSKSKDLDQKSIHTINKLVTEPKERTTTKLEHLRLVLTNKCNLKCIYCYANGGSYNQDILDMNLDTIINTVNYFYDKFTWIHQISFFGGEPLIKIDLIEKACEYILDFCEKNNRKLPIFSMVTNGVLLNGKAIEIIKKYNIAINVSLDGPKEFNDRQRKFVGKNESVFDVVDKNIKQLRKEKKFSIESTCSNIINDFDFKFDYIQEFFRNRYSIERVNVSAAVIVNDVDESLDLQGEKKEERYLRTIVERFFNKQGEKYVFNDVIIRLLNTYFSNYYCASFCDAGITQFTISMNGDIYPCQVFLTNKENSLGNVNEFNYKKLEDFKENNKKSFSKCVKCGYKRYCQTCLCKRSEIEFNDNYCQEVKKGTRLFLKNMFDLKVNDEAEYDKLLKEYKKFYEDIM